MPYIVQEIIEENPELAKARADEPLLDALARMIEHDFSQLPIVDEAGKPDGMITSDSILRALNNFGVGLDKLLAGHARTRVDSFREDTDLFELLDRLGDNFAVLIVDGAGCLTGIVTNFDTAEYFRRRAEDMMLVEDVETLLKDYIQAAFKDDEDQIDEAKLADAVKRFSGSSREQQEQFKRALRHYLNLEYGKEAKYNQEALDKVVDEHFKVKQRKKHFDDLTLSQYITLLVDGGWWDSYRPVFNLEREAMRNLLNKVRRTRNELAHFQGELSQAQRKQLRFAAEWFAQHEEKINDLFAGSSVKEEPVQEAEIEEFIPAEDEVEPGESRYAPLAIWLESQPPDKNIVKPTFSKIEEIIGGPLPPTAYKHRSWWANDPAGHVQAQQWVDAGWRMSSINMTTQVVRFTRIRDRQKAYIDFYSSLLTEMREQPGFALDKAGPHGGSWHDLEYISVNGKKLGAFVFSFGRGRIFRVELYIDPGDKALNKELFDRLAEESEAIEGVLGQELYWQRLDNRKASRISIIFKDAAITNSQEQLNELQQAVVPAMVEFKKVMLPRVQEVGKGIV